MKISVFVSPLLILFLFFSVSAQIGRLYTVDDAGDTRDAANGDGLCADAARKCTLRAAIEEANADVYPDAINFALPVPAVINLTLGELSITKNVYIAGQGARNLTVRRSTAQGTANFRIFSVQDTENLTLPVTIRGMTIANGKADTDGGAIYINYQTRFQLIDAAVTSNTATGSGGAIFNAGTLTLNRVLISSNTATGMFGGGIVNINTQAASIIADSTLTGNSSNQGGAIYNSGSLLLVNNTISRNSAQTAGAGVFNDSSGTVNILNTIIGQDNGSVASLAGAFASLGNNLITDARNSTGFTDGANGDQVSNNNTINPLLGNLADNGGPTDTLALLAGSPAINRGNNCVYNGNCAAPVPVGFRLSVDQRVKYLRLSSTVDVGAYEYLPLSFAGNLGIGTLANRNRAGGTLVVLTEGSTNIKQYRVTNPFGNYSFSGLKFGEVYFLETRPKRSSERRGLAIFPIDTLPSLPSFFAESDRDSFRIFSEDNLPDEN